MRGDNEAEKKQIREDQLNSIFANTVRAKFMRVSDVTVQRKLLEEIQDNLAKLNERRKSQVYYLHSQVVKDNQDLIE
jgi:hypothetical protein